MVDFKYSIYGKQYGFKPITTQDALKIKNIMFVLAKDNTTIEDNEKANSAIDNLCFKYLVLKDESGIEFDNINAQNFETFFQDVQNASFGIVEISKNFMEMIGGFLNALPSYQGLQTKK